MRYTLFTLLLLFFTFSLNSALRADNGAATQNITFASTDLDQSLSGAASNQLKQKKLLQSLPSQELNFTTPTLITAQCCKICRKGKACGNSCISRLYTCRKPPGCACDAGD